MARKVRKRFRAKNRGPMGPMITDERGQSIALAYASDDEVQSAARRMAPFAAAWLSQRGYALTRDPAESATNTFICWGDLNRANAAVHGHVPKQDVGT